MTGCGSEVDSDHAPANGNPTQASASASVSPSDASKPAMDAYPEVEWVALMPQDDLDALLNPPAYLDEKMTSTR